MVQGALELIGVRAVIVDFRTYLNQGRQMEAATAAIGKATEGVEKAALKTAQAQTRLDAINQQVIAGNVRLSASYNNLTAARARLNSAQAAAASPAAARLGLTGTTQANLAAAQHGVEVAEAEVALAKRSIPTLGAQAAARNAVTASTLREAAAVEKLTAAEAKQEGLAASRRKLLAGTAAVAGGAAFLGIGAASINAASKYQNTLTKINVLTNTSAEDTAKLSKEFLELSKVVPSSPDELGGAAYFVLSSGIKDVGTALEITKLSAKDAAIGLGSAQDAAKNLTQIIAAYGTENISASQANDILIQAIREGRAEAQDFAGSLGRILPIASAIGVKFNEVAAAMSILTNGGLSADEAATGLRAIMNDLTKSSDQANAALKTVGLSANEVRQMIQDRGLVATMQKLIELFQGNLAAIEPIIPNIRGLVAASSAFISQGGRVEDVLNNINNAGGSTDKAFAEVSKTFSFQAGLLKNTLNRALIEIGTAILPTVTKAAQDLSKWFEQNRQAVQDLMTKGLQAFIELLKDVASVLGLVVQVLSWIPNNEASISAAVLAIGAAFAWALPGSALQKGLALILLSLGQIIQSEQGSKESLTKRVLRAGIPLATGALAVGGTALATGGIGLGGASVAFGAGALGGNFLTKLILGDVDKGIQDTNDALNPLNDLMKQFGGITLPNLNRNTSGVAEQDKKLANELQKLAGEFKSTSDAAANVESLTKDLKLFGEVNKDLADAFKLSALDAGAVQAADAVSGALERIEKRHFEYVKTLGTVASLIVRGATDLAKEVTLGVARNALKASQTALNAVLSGPTKEVAALGVPLAQSRLREAQINQRVNPQLYALKQSSDNIEKQLKIIDKKQSDEDKRRKTRDDAVKTAYDRQSRILSDQLDALKYANDLAKNAYEIQAEKLQDLIDANKKAVSDLQANFLKSNEALQQQINQAIGAGQSDVALGLVRQQQEATRQFRAQNTGLNAAGQNLTDQQKTAERAEKQREREAQLAEDRLNNEKKALDRQNDLIEATNKQRDSFVDLTLNTDAQKEALQAQKDAIDEQTAALDHEKDVQGQVTQKIQDQIAVYQAETDLLKARGEAANAALLTQQEQSRLAEELNTQIGIESQAIRDLVPNFHDLIPEVKDATEQFNTLKGLLEVFNSDTVRQQFTPAIDGAAKRAAILDAAMGDAATGVGNATNSIGQSAHNLATEVANVITGMEKQLLSAQSNEVPKSVDEYLKKKKPSDMGAGGGVRRLFQGAADTVLHAAGQAPGFFSNAFNFAGFAQGGFTGKGGGFVHPNEVVLPLNDISRSREIFGQLPAGFAASLNRGRSGPKSIFGDLNVSGATLDDMRVMAHRAVDEAFTHSARTARNGGSLLSIGVGAGGF